MSELANCSNCGRVFVRGLTSICPACQKEVNEKFEKVYRYVRKKENRQATIQEVREATGVEESLIIQFVKEGRLRTRDLTNFHYPCQSCGKPIQSGTLCENCQKGINEELSTFEKQQAATLKNVPKRSATRTYYTYNKNK